MQFEKRPLIEWTDDDWRAKKFEIREAFSPAAPINERDNFSGRIVELQRLTDAVFERGRHPILFGEKGVGKTSLGNTFHKLIGEHATRTLYPIWHQITPDDDFDSIWRVVFDDMVVEYETDNGEKVRERISDQYDHIRPSDVIKELKNTSNGKNKVIILDEYDKLEDENAKRLLPHCIKALSDRGVNATMMLIGVADSIDELVAEHNSVNRNITEIRMPRMDDNEAQSLIVERAERLSMSLDVDAKWKIITLARGLPSYLHQLTRDAMLEAVKSKSLKVIEAHVDTAINMLATQSDQSIYAAYSEAVASNNSRNQYKEVLLACAIAKTDDMGHFILSDVVEPLARILKKSVKIANFSSHIEAFTSEARGCVLEQKGAKRGYKYRFSEPKMQPYVIMRGIAKGILAEDALSIFSPPLQPSLPLTT